MPTFLWPTASCADLPGPALGLSLLMLFGTAFLASDASRMAAHTSARRAHRAAWLAFGASLIAAGAVAWTGPINHTYLQLSPALSLSLYLDAVACTMLVLVSFLGALVIRYARHYLAGDARQGRFIRWLCLTLLAVLVLIAAGNLAVFALAWVATSLCLHQLLVFYPERPAAQLAARKKFIVSRVAEACLVLAIVLIYHGFGTLDFAAMHVARQAATSLPRAELAWIASLLVVSALLKSAQLPFHGWLPEVMETPTPVSALLHAGIINAGGYLLIRTSPVVQLYQPALDAMAVVGAATALIAGLIMLTQTSVKVSLAWSTCAQMGFMLLQCGLGSYATALLHIVAHSLYKAHAFLSAGSVVERSRAAARVGSNPAPPPLRLLLMLLGALTLALGLSFALGSDPRGHLGESVLGSILVMSMVYLLYRSSAPIHGMPVLVRGIALGVATSTVYVGLQFGAAALVGGLCRHRMRRPVLPARWRSPSWFCS